MTTERSTDYEELPAGRRSDLLVATKLLGWYWGPVRAEAWAAANPAQAAALWELGSPDGTRMLLPKEPGEADIFGLPLLTVNLVDAWRLYDRLRDGGWTVEIGASLADGCWAKCAKDVGEGQLYFEAHAERDEEALALCRLSLMAEEPPPPPPGEPDVSAVERLAAEIRAGLEESAYYVVPYNTFCEALNVPASNQFSAEDQAIRFAANHDLILQRFDAGASVLEFRHPKAP